MTALFAHYRVIAYSIWIIAVACSLVWNSVDNIRERKFIAHETAKAFYEQIIATRHWNLANGGVYVFTTPHSPPNPYLAEETRTIKDENGKSLTLINPAYMTRQIAEISQEKGSITFHITSLNPLRKGNAPYPWEIPWLQTFNNGAKEQGAFVMENGQEIFRYMAPLPFKKTCTPCHLKPDNQYGTRGAISVTFPSQYKNSSWPLLFSHLFVALLGIAFINFFGKQLAESRRNLLRSNNSLASEIEERKETEKELLQVKENLEQTVNHRTAELRQSNDSLDRRVKEQQRIEAALVSINDEFIQIFNSAPDGMHVVDKNHTVIRVNRAYSTLLGKQPEEIQGRKCYDSFAGKLCHTEQCPLNQIIKGVERVEVEANKTKANGETVPCLITATPFHDPKGRLSGIIVVTRDISNWKNIEDSLSATARNLRRRNAELEDFAHVISHDLQEPLMLIKSFSERIRKKCTDELPESGHKYLEHIEHATQRMKSLIDGLLLYSRVTSKANPFEKVDLQEITKSVLEDLTLKIEIHNAIISVDQGLPSIEADPLQMRQLMQNIIGNSLKYHHPRRPPEITIQCVPFPDTIHSQTHIRFSITDNGIGFDKKYKNQIFDIFQRLHTRQQFQGTGIGLSICKKIIERHRGTITAEATPKQGATFTITLPKKQQSNDKPHKDRSLIDIILNRR